MLSDWITGVLRACDGSRSIEQVVNQLSHQMPDVGEDVREYAIVRLLESVHVEGFIEIYRVDSETRDESKGSLPAA